MGKLNVPRYRVARSFVPKFTPFGNIDGIVVGPSHYYLVGEIVTMFINLRFDMTDYGLVGNYLLQGPDDFKRQFDSAAAALEAAGTVRAVTFGTGRVVGVDDGGGEWDFIGSVINTAANAPFDATMKLSYIAEV